MILLFHRSMVVSYKIYFTVYEQIEFVSLLEYAARTVQIIRRHEIAKQKKYTLCKLLQR